MRYRRFGRSDLEVSELGYGAWGIGRSQWVGADDEESLAALRRALELGVNLIDTALAYGNGHSERLVGAAVKQASGTVYVASKIPPKNSRWPARPGVPVADVFPARWIVDCTEQSLKNLGLETIDVQQLHVWSDEWVGQGDWLDAVERLKREGKIRLFGVSINDHEPANALRLIETGVVDSVQVIYNIFDQSPEDELFPRALADGIGVLARVPFDEGSLTGAIRPETTFPPGDFRNSYFAGDRKRNVWERVQAIASDLGIEIDELPSVALRFCISHEALSTVIPGMRSVRNVERNVAAVEAGPLDDEQLGPLRHHRWIPDDH